MTDKVQKIREEVEMLFNHVKDSNFESDSGAFYYLKDLLDYIDSLQEEPVSEDLEAEIKRINKNNHFDFSDWKAIARHFANWQKKQDQETIELAEDHAMLAGMVKGKEEVIEKTINFLNWIIGTGNSTIEEYKKYINN